MLLASPLLDLVNGIWIYLINGGDGGMLGTYQLTESASGPSFAIRMVFLAVMLLYVFFNRKTKVIGVFVVIGISWAATFAFAILRGRDVELVAEVSYIVRFCYCLLAMLFCADMLRLNSDREAMIAKLDRVLTLAVLTAGLGVLVPYLFEIGFYTYADPLGYRGSRGFYYAGNDITVVMMALLPVVLTSWMQAENWRCPWNILKAVTAALCAVAMLIIGTKTSFVALAGTAVVLPVYALIRGVRKQGWQELIRVAAVAVLATAIFFGLGLLNADPGQTVQGSIAATEQYAEEQGAELAVFSGRLHYLRTAWKDFAGAGPLAYLLGIGRGGQDHIIEMDICEVFVYYGLLGCVTMLWLYLTNGFKLVIDLFRNFSLRNLACCLALALSVGFLVMAGHVLFSVTGGFYFAFMIAYTRLVCSPKGMETQLI